MKKLEGAPTAVPRCLVAALALYGGGALAAPLDAAAVQREWARHDALEPGRLSAVSPHKALTQAAAALGEAPTFWERMCLLPACSSGESEPSLALEHLLEATAGVRAQVAAQEARLAALEAGLEASTSPHCVFRRCRSLIPTHADHRFQSIAITPERDDAGFVLLA